MKKTLRLLLFIAIMPVLLSTVTQPLLAISDDDQKYLFTPFFDPNAQGDTCYAGGSTEASEAIPPMWSSLIYGVASKHSNTDPRTVAATHWVENRGWGASLETDYWRGLNDSSAGARGPWQFLPGSWHGWDSGIRNWNHYEDESTYSASASGRDGDGDGIRDPYNPRDAVEAAYVYLDGTQGLPLIEGFNGNVEESYNNTVTENSLLYRIALYNGSPRKASQWLGRSLSELPYEENSNYIKMAYWLIATDFREGLLVSSGEEQVVDAASRSTEDSDVPQPSTPDGCGGVALSADGYAFPARTTKTVVQEGAPNAEGTVLRWLHEQQTNYHHNYPAIDLHVPEGTEILAAFSGEVRRAYTRSNMARVQIMGDNGSIYYYNHMLPGSHQVSDGDTVTAGQTIALAGDYTHTGNGSAAHLHLDALPPPYTERVSCSGSACSGYPFIDMQPIMHKLYKQLPE